LSAGLVQDAKNKIPDAQGYSQRSFVDDVISRVRTDLDAFTEAEKSVLENHGYFNAITKSGDGCRSWFLKVLPNRQRLHPVWMDEERVRRALRHSHCRVP